MAVNWQYVGHTAVGVIITTCQAISMADPDPKVLNVCHIISLVALQLGISFGVWQASLLVATQKDNATLTNRLALHEFPAKPEPLKVHAAEPEVVEKVVEKAPKAEASA